MEDEYLLSHLEDLYHEMEANSYLTHSAFLSFDEQAAYLELFKQKKREPSSLFFYGGALEAERKMAVFLPYYMDKDAFLENERNHPTLLHLLFIYPKSEKFGETSLTHRDYLGALMNIGIERDCVGDIYTDGKIAYAYIKDGLEEEIKSSLKKVKHTDVKIEEVNPFDCPLAPHFEEVTGSVSSLRLDSILSFAFHLSREKAKNYIDGDLVSVNGVVSHSATMSLKRGDRISCASKGKFVYQGEIKTSRKGRLIIGISIAR